MSVEFKNTKYIVIPTKYANDLSMTLRGQLKHILNRVDCMRRDEVRKRENRR